MRTNDLYRAAMDGKAASRKEAAGAAPPARKDVLLVGTCYCRNLDHAGQTILPWYELLTRSNPRLHDVSDFVLVDSFSPVDFHEVFPDVPIEYHRSGESDVFHHRIAPGLPLRIVSFADNVGHLNPREPRKEKDGWGRAMVQAMRLAMDNDYRWVIHLETDFFVKGPDWVTRFYELLKDSDILFCAPRCKIWNLLETALFAVRTDYLEDIRFIERYDWKDDHVGKQPAGVIPERFLELLVRGKWVELTMFGDRDNKKNVSYWELAANDYGYVTHITRDRDRFLWALGLREDAELDKELPGHLNGFRRTPFCLKGKRQGAGRTRPYRTEFDRELPFTRIHDAPCAPQIPDHPSERVLVHGTFSYGDALMMTPALRLLWELDENIEIVVWTNRKGREILYNNPYIHRFLTLRGTPRPLKILSDRYDRVVNLWGYIFGKPDSELEPISDVACRLAGVEPGPVPLVYCPTSREVLATNNILSEAVPERDGRRLILIHNEPSSAQKRLPRETMLEIMEILEGHGEIPLYASWGESDDALERLESAGAVCLQSWLKKCNARQGFALSHLVDGVIAADSCFSHLAVAAGVPTVVCYGPHDGLNYSGRYPNVTALQSIVPCSPCQNQYNCSLSHHRGIPPTCMRHFEGGEICEALFERLDRTGLDGGRGPERCPTRSWRATLDAHDCLWCGAHEPQFLTRKSCSLYAKCRSCGSIFCIDPSGSEDGFFTQTRRYLLDSAERSDMGQVFGFVAAQCAKVSQFADNEGLVRRSCLELGAGDGLYSTTLAGLGWECSAYEPDPVYAEVLRKLDIQWLSLDEALECPARLFGCIVLPYGIQFLCDPNHAFERIGGSLERGGFFVSVFPSSDFLRPRSNWGPVNSSCPGESRLFPSFQALVELAERHGLTLYHQEKVHARASYFVVLKKD